MDFQKVINSRRSVHSFQDKQVTKKVILDLIKDGCKAPSSNNMQPWNFVVVTGKKRDLIARSVKYYLSKKIKNASLSKRLREVAIKFYANLGNAPVIILVYMNKDQKYKHTMRLSIAAATQNIVLSAVNKGMGACWMGTLNSISRSINKILKIKKELVAGIILGYPAKDFRAIKRKKKKLSEVLTFV